MRLRAGPARPGIRDAGIGGVEPSAGSTCACVLVKLGLWSHHDDQARSRRASRRATWTLVLEVEGSRGFGEQDLGIR